MKTSIFKQTIHELCMDFLEFLEVSIDENPESFPCTIAYINFLCELKEKGIEVKVGNILSSDTFYDAQKDSWKKWGAMGVMGVEMEAAALYMNAAYAGVNALCLLTVSDSLVTHEATTPEERQNTFTQMMEIALELA